MLVRRVKGLVVLAIGEFPGHRRPPQARFRSSGLTIPYRADHSRSLSIGFSGCGPASYSRKAHRCRR